MLIIIIAAVAIIALSIALRIAYKHQISQWWKSREINNVNERAFKLRLVFSLGLLIAFFLPWLDLVFFRLSGFDIPTAYERLSNVFELFDAGFEFVEVIYLLYLIPVLAIYNILIDLKLLRVKRYILLNDFVIGLVISGLVFLLFYLEGIRHTVLDIGYYLTVLFSLIGLALCDLREAKKEITVDNVAISPEQINSFRVEAIKRLKATNQPFDEFDVELEAEQLKKEYNEQLVQKDAEQREMKKEEEAQKEKETAKNKKTAKIIGGIVGGIVLLMFIVIPYIISPIIVWVDNFIENRVQNQETRTDNAISVGDVERIDDAVVMIEGVVINGVRWATRNVDAPGTFARNPENAGRFFTWENAQNACPPGWRVPTPEEFQSLYNAAGSEWTTVNRVNGLTFGTAPNQIFLPAAGRRVYTETLFYEDEYDSYWRDVYTALFGVEFGAYWSSTGMPLSLEIYLYFCYNYIGLYGWDWGESGLSVRCVAE